MKKLFILIAFTMVGLMSASTKNTGKETTKTIVNKEYKVIKVIQNFKMPLGIIRQTGIFAYDTATDGTCFVYGTLVTDTDSGVSIFFPASLATQSTQIVPPCTGFNSYLC